MRQQLPTIGSGKKLAGLIALAAAAATGGSSIAATLDWDTNTGTWGIQSGPGTWYENNSGSQTWWTGSANAQWTNGNIAHFETAGLSVVDLSGAISTTGMQNYQGGLLRLAAGSSLSSSGQFVLGYSPSSADAGRGALYQSGGTVTTTGTNRVVVGYEKAYGFYQLSGGNLNVGGTLSIARVHPGGVYGVGAFYQSGGDITLSDTSSNSMEIATSSTGGAKGVYYMTGGTVTSTGGFSLANRGINSSAQLTISNATMASTSTTGTVGRLTVGYANPASQSVNQTAVFNLNSGGVLQVARITSDGATSDPSAVQQVNFNGGTVRFIGTSDGIQGNLIASGQQFTSKVFAGGVTFDITQSSTAFATISASLDAPTGNGISDTTVAVAAGGSGYIGAPIVTIAGATGATAVANMTDDGSGNGTFKVASITVTGRGIDASGTPTYSFSGGGTTGTQATGGSLSTSANVSGGLTKTGVGILRINAAQGYTGATNVQAGTLSLLAPGDLSASSGVYVKSGATLDASGKTGAVLQRLGGAGTVKAKDGIVADRLQVTQRLTPGDGGVGTLTISSGDLRVGNGVTYDYEIGGTTASPVSDLIDLTQSLSGGDVSFDGVWTLKLLDVGTVDPTGKQFILFDYTSGSVPSWSGVTVDTTATNWAGGTVSVDTTNRRIVLSDLSVVPEPTGTALLALAALPLARRRRR